MILKLPSELLEEIAQRARERRKDMKLSQEEIADRSGVSLGSVKRFETTGKISLESLLKLALVLDSLGDFEGLFKRRDESRSLDEIIRSGVKTRKQ